MVGTKILMFKAINKFGEQLTIRERMAYGLACLASYLRYHCIDWQLYKDEIERLSFYTSSTDLQQWEQDTKYFFSKYTDEQRESGIPYIFEMLYYIGVGDMYGKYQGISATELYSVVETLEKEGIEFPKIDLFSDYLLVSPMHDDDYYGSTFLCSDFSDR